MDLPYNLSLGRLVSGKEELQQSLTVLCKNYLGTFHQSPRLGATFSVHMPAINLKELVKQTLEEVSGITVQSVEVTTDGFIASIMYHSQFIDFKFILKDENSTAD